MNKAPLMDTAKINVLPDYPETLKDRKIALFTAQRDSDHEYYMKLIKEIELECEVRLKEQSVIHSMEIEQVRKETAEEILKVTDGYTDLLVQEIESMVTLAHSHGWKSTKFEQGKIFREQITKLKSKYKIEE